MNFVPENKNVIFIYEMPKCNKQRCLAYESMLNFGHSLFRYNIDS